MNLIYYIFFVIYFFSTSIQVESKLNHVKVTHKNGAKTYTVGGKKFKTFRNAHRYNKKRSRLLKRKPNRRPARRLTRKNTGRQTNRVINRRPINKPNRFQPIFQPLVPKPQPTQPPIIATTTKADEIAEKIKTYYKDINEYRKKHKADPLKVNDEVVKRAEECAKDYAKNKRQQESLTLKYVRNFARFDEGLDDAVEFWYSTRDNHEYDRPKFKEATKYFIHMIWKSATDMGCGIVHDVEYFVCCEFFPVEKFDEADELRKNVLKE